MDRLKNRVNKNTIVSAIRFVTSHPLNRQNKIKAVGRFFQWQLISRISPMPLIMDFVNGSRLIIGGGTASGSVNYYTGLEEFEDMCFVLHVLRKGDWFVDVGANIGVFTILAGACARANCMSIEPVPEAFNRLSDNIKLNDIEQIVEVFNIGLASQEGLLKFTTGLGTENHVLVDAKSNVDTVEAPVKKLDDLMGDRAPAVIKIDVEGFEAEVVAGAVNTLSKDSVLAVIMEFMGHEKRYGYDEKELISQMMEMGYKDYTYSPFERQLFAEKNRSDYLKHKNTIFIKSIEVVCERIKTAAKFTTNNGCEL